MRPQAFAAGARTFRGGPRPEARGPSGFTLLEVMVGLALLGFALVVLMRSTAGNIRAAEQSHMLGVATDLARAKMYDIEESLMKDGFSDTEVDDCNKDFSEEGWPNIHYCSKVIPVDMPNFEDLQAMARGQATHLMGSGAGAGSADAAALAAAAGSASSDEGSDDALGAFQNSMLGGMLGGMLGAGGTDVLGAQGAAVLQMQYQMFQEILKDTIRKVTLQVSWTVLGRDEDFTVVAFFTDPAAMDRVLNGTGAVDLSGTAAGSGPGSGAGPGSGVHK